VSLETPIGEEEDSHLGDFISDDDVPEPAEAASFMLLKEQLVSVLKTLTPREEKVLKLRFGVEDGRTRTLEEVARSLTLPVSASARLRQRHCASCAIPAAPKNSRISSTEIAAILQPALSFRQCRLFVRKRVPCKNDEIFDEFYRFFDLEAILV